MCGHHRRACHVDLFHAHSALGLFGFQLEHIFLRTGRSEKGWLWVMRAGRRCDPWLSRRCQLGTLCHLWSIGEEGGSFVVVLRELRYRSVPALVRRAPSVITIAIVGREIAICMGSCGRLRNRREGLMGALQRVAMRPGGAIVWRGGPRCT